MNSKNLILRTISIPSENPNPDKDTGELEDEAFEEYKRAEIINSVGKKEFKETYLIFKDDIRESPPDAQIVFLRKLLEKIYQVYDVEFSRKIDVIQEMENIYNFIEFFMFKYIKFYAKIWTELGVEFYKIDIKNYVLNNPTKVLNIFNKLLKKYKELPTLYKLLMQSIPGQKILSLFIHFTILRREEILAEILSLIILNREKE